MIREINFTGRTGRFDVPSFLLTDNETLVLKFNVPTIRQGVFCGVIKHGNTRSHFKLEEDMTLTIWADKLNEGGAGALEIILELRTLDMSRVIIPSGRENGGYWIEPLLIEKVDDTFTAIGWLQRIESGMEEMALQIEELHAIVDTIPSLVEKAKNEAIVVAAGGDVMNA